MAVGDLLGGGALLPEATVTAPSLAPVDVEQNKGLWKQFLSQIQQPNFRQAAFTTGLNLLRSPQIGQSGWDVGANALGAGFNTLTALREADRVRGIQEEERRIAEEQRKTENIQKERQLTTAEETAKTYREATETQAGAAKSREAREAEALQETKRGARENEISDRIRANAAMIAAQRERSGGRVAAEIEEIDGLTEYYKTKGMTDTAAKARAILEIKQGAKRKSLAGLRAGYKGDLLKAWAADPTNIGKGVTPEILKNIEAAAGEMAQSDIEAEVEASDMPPIPAPGVAPPPVVAPNAAPGGVSPPPATVSSAVQTPSRLQEWAAKAGVKMAPTGIPPITPPPAALPQVPQGAAPPAAAPQMAQAADPEIMRKIQNARAMGRQPQAIKEALLADGINPAIYGL